MNGTDKSDFHVLENMKEYRLLYNAKKKSRLAELDQIMLKQQEKEDEFDFEVIVFPRMIDMENIRGTDRFIAYQIEALYKSDGGYVFNVFLISIARRIANDKRRFNPKSECLRKANPLYLKRSLVSRNHLIVL